MGFVYTTLLLNNDLFYSKIIGGQNSGGRRGEIDGEKNDVKKRMRGLSGKERKEDSRSKGGGLVGKKLLGLWG